MVFAVSTPTDRLPPFSLEVDRSRVEKHQIQGREQVAAIRKQGFFDLVFRATGSKGSCSSLMSCG